ncbi:pilus assembly protein PilP [Pseudomonas sp. BJa5]|uniref:pilus assembly protein PilP n=1 Tax=Pseudomonas sp. BJa5 TaxID=2936270 RepID=UPI0025597182|nr:pilus assembly protein PilP [Pseudomonas sp. BGr12]MDL2421784.1 pilus assembly protein PilP [Pseudomonas sp. BGr12]
MSQLSGPLWQQLAGASRMRQGALLLGILGVLLGVAYFVHLRALFVDVDERTEQSRRLSGEVAGKAERVQALADSEAQLAAAREALDTLRWRLAAGGEMAGLLENVAQLGYEHGLFVEQLERLPDVMHDQHIELPMQLQLQGSYAALAAFALGLARLPRLVTLQDFSLVPAGEQAPGQLRMQVRASAYRARGTSARGAQMTATADLAPPAAGISRSPFEPSLMQQRGDLQGLPLEQFEMVGSLVRRQVRFALLRAAGVVYRLQLGDRLGRDHGRVVSIEEGQVEVVEAVFVVDKGWVERRRTLRLKPSARAG